MNTKFYSNRQEKEIAKQLKGKKQSNSGATPFKKGDIITDKFLIEAKTSTKEVNSVSIKREWLQKINEEAFAMGKPYFSLVFDFGDTKNKEFFYIINEELFKKLNQILKEE